MSCPNFYFEHKAILVTNEDIESENLPNLGEHFLEYDGTELSDYDFKWWRIILRYGHYRDAIITYSSKFCELDCLKDEILWECETQAELYAYFHEEYDMPYNVLRAICGKVGDNDIKQYLDTSCDKLFEYLSENEEEDVLQAISKLSEEYGYKPISCVAVMGNGEALYQYD